MWTHNPNVCFLDEPGWECDFDRFNEPNWDNSSELVFLTCCPYCQTESTMLMFSTNTSIACLLKMPICVFYSRDLLSVTVFLIKKKKWIPRRYRVSANILIILLERTEMAQSIAQVKTTRKFGGLKANRFVFYLQQKTTNWRRITRLPENSVDSTFIWKMKKKKALSFNWMENDSRRNDSRWWDLWKRCRHDCVP